MDRQASEVTDPAIVLKAVKSECKNGSLADRVTARPVKFHFCKSHPSTIGLPQAKRMGYLINLSFMYLNFKVFNPYQKDAASMQTGLYA